MENPITAVEQGVTSALSSLHLSISGTLPGELVIIAIIDLEKKLFESMSTDEQKKVADHIGEQFNRLLGIWDKLLDKLHVPAA